MSDQPQVTTRFKEPRESIAPMPRYLRARSKKRERFMPFVEVPPAVVKKYATGRGNAKKNEMLGEAIRRLGYDGNDDNEADAAWLRACVMDALGEPVVTMPELHRSVLGKVTQALREAASPAGSVLGKVKLP